MFSWICVGGAQKKLCLSCFFIVFFLHFDILIGAMVTKYSKPISRVAKAQIPVNLWTREVNLRKHTEKKRRDGYLSVHVSDSGNGVGLIVEPSATGKHRAGLIIRREDVPFVACELLRLCNVEVTSDLIEKLRQGIEARQSVK